MGICPEGNFPSLLLLGLVQVAAIEQEGANEGIEVAIENFLDVAALDLGAVVFYELVRLEGVRADLASEADFGLGGVELAQVVAALVQLEFVKLRLENLHGDFAIFVLAAFVLALDDDAGGQLGDADGGFDFVDVLAAVAASAECVNAQVFGLDDDFDLVVNFGDYECGCERGVAAGGLVEGRDADQAMDAAFAGEHAVGIFAFDLNRG